MNAIATSMSYPRLLWTDEVNGSSAEFGFYSFGALPLLRVVTPARRAVQSTDSDEISTYEISPSIANEPTYVTRVNYVAQIDALSERMRNGESIAIPEELSDLISHVVDLSGRRKLPIHDWAEALVRSVFKAR